MWSFLGIAVSAALTLISLRGAMVASRTDLRHLRSAETFRRLQWAVDLALDRSNAHAATGMAALEGLLRSAELSEKDRNYVYDIMAVVSKVNYNRTDGEVA